MNLMYWPMYLILRIFVISFSKSFFFLNKKIYSLLISFDDFQARLTSDNRSFVVSFLQLLQNRRSMTNFVAGFVSNKKSYFLLIYFRTAILQQLQKWRNKGSIVRSSIHLSRIWYGEFWKNVCTYSKLFLNCICLYFFDLCYTLYN